MNASFRRWNIVIISVLAALAFGVLIAVIIPGLQGTPAAADGKVAPKQSTGRAAHRYAPHGVQIENLVPSIGRQLGVPANGLD